MEFKDIIKKSFLEGFGEEDISIKTAILCLIFTLIIAFYIFLIYKVMTEKTLYRKDFGISLVLISIITAMLIFIIQTDVNIAIGMVGMVCIVRFKTLANSILDTVYMLWAIAAGIICGSGLGEYAVIMSLVLSIILLILRRFPNVKVSEK